MKKLMIAAAIVCAAAFAQASSVMWYSQLASGLDYSYFVDAKGEPVTSISPFQVVLCSLTAGSDLQGEWSVKRELDVGTLTEYGDAYGEFSKNYTETGFDIADGDVLAVLLKDEKGKYQTINYYDSKNGIVTDTITVAGLDGDNGQKNLYSATLEFGSKGNMAAPVPEPTSGLLLLLGVAGLALRRRRA